MLINNLQTCSLDWTALIQALWICIRIIKEKPCAIYIKIVFVLIIRIRKDIDKTVLKNGLIIEIFL